MKDIKILLADDHDLLRDGLRALLSDVAQIQISGSVCTGNEVIEFLENHQVDIVLMDIKMPGLNGIDTTEIITKRFPSVKVIGLSMFNDKTNIAKMLSAGASAYLLKNMHKEELLKAIHEVSEGNPYFSKEVAEVMLSSYMPGKKGNQAIPGFNIGIELSGREVEVLQLIAKQLTNKEIADKLCLSPRTIDSHRRNILQKIGAKNTAGLVSFAFSAGIADQGSIEATKMVFN